MLHTLISLAFIGAALASPAGLLQSRQVPPGTDGPTSESCLSLQNSCNATTVDLNNFYSYVPCIMLTTCMQGVENPAQVLQASGAPANQSRLTEDTFYSMSGGNADMTQQNYIDAYYGAIAQTLNGTYPDNVTYVIEQWQTIAAWTGFCDTLDIPYSNFADWLEYSSVPGVCPTVSSCQSAIAETTKPCVPQPITDNGSCAAMVTLCQPGVTNGLFQSEYCVLASFCYAWSNTDVLLVYEYSSNVSIPTTPQQARLSEAVFSNMTGGASTMSQQNAIDAYYGALTASNGPFPTSAQYVIDFWAIINAWTGSCSTLAISYSNLADYLSYAAESGYHPTC